MTEVMEPYRPASAAAVDQLAREVSALRRAQRRASSKPGLAHSAVDDGAVTITVDGQVTGLVGRQHDGTTGAAVVAGPTPPVPLAATMETVTSGVRIRWTGGFVDPQPGWSSPVVAPMDFKAVEVEVSTSLDFTTGTVRSAPAIASEAGGYTFVPWTGGTNLYARLRTRSHAGKASGWSVTAGPVAAGLVGVGDVNFDLAQLGGGRLFYQPTQPAVTLGPDDRAVWWDSDDGNRPYTWSGTAWVSRRIGNGAIEPDSLIASDLLVDGTITAPLLQTVLVLTTAVVAGDPTGDHARMNPTGFRVYRANTSGGTEPEEVVRMGTTTNDFISVVDRDGGVRASIDDTGRGVFAGMSVNAEPVIQGKPLGQVIKEAGSGAMVGRHYIGTFEQRTLPIRGDIGLAQFVFPITAGHSYQIQVNGPFAHWGPGNSYGQTAAPSEMQMHYRVATTTGSTPVNATINSTEIFREFYSGVPDYGWVNAEASFMYESAVTGLASLLACMVCLYGNNAMAAAWGFITFQIVDLGPTYYGPTTWNQGGGTWGNGAAGTVQPARRQYDTGEMAPVGWRTFRGNGVQRTDTDDVVQGTDPSGANGDGYGYWWWNIPTITGTVDEAWIYLYADHWYYAAGGTALVAMSNATGGAASWLTTAFGHTNWPRTAGRWLRLSQADADRFKTGARGFGLRQSGSSNLTYYGRFPGAAARLRLKYTQ